MAEKLKNMTYAELPKSFDAYRHILADFHHDPVIESMLGTGKRSTEVQASLFDCIHAELLGERDAEKAKVRNRRKNDRKYKLTPKMRKEQKYLRNWNVCMKMINFGTWDDIPIVEGRVQSAEKIARADFDAEIHQHEDAMQEYADYCLMAEQHEERLEYLRNLTGNVEFWEIIIIEISREKIYEENRIREMRNIANTIMKGECY